MIDHLFMLVDPAGPEIRYLQSLGLVEAYRRTHPGQGTRNICYCFDNLFLELLWVEDAIALQASAIQRTGLYERSQWRTSDACPFGIAVRPSPPGLQSGFRSPISAWEFIPPYLPAGMSIAVATDSDDPRQPMIFESPGSTSPADWPIEKRGLLQHPAGLGPVTQVKLTLPASAPPCHSLQTIASQQVPPILVERSGDYRLTLSVASLSDRPDTQIVLQR